MINWNAYDTTKPRIKPVAWGNMKEESLTQPCNTISIQHVPKHMAVFSTILHDHVEFNKYLKQVILEHRQNNPETTESNVKAWHSTWRTHEENPKFQPLVEKTLELCKFISKSYYECSHVNFQVLNLWAMMYEDTEYTKRHSHFPSDFAACYYVDVEPGCAPVLFENAVKDGIHDNNQPLTVQPENGMLLVWPAILHHEVPPTKGRRMCVSMNIDKGERTSYV